MSLFTDIRKFFGPSSEDYDAGYEDCRKEILAYLETRRVYQKKFNLPPVLHDGPVILVIRAGSWRSSTASMRIGLAEAERKVGVYD